MKQTLHIRDISQEEKGRIEVLYTSNLNRLQEYAELLMWWNKKVNLISRDVSRETVMMHIKHSLMVSLSGLFNKEKIIIDTGTGGGLPGIPLALSCNLNLILNDIVSKKIFAVNDMVQKLTLTDSARTITAPIQSVAENEGELVITKHAFKVPELLGFCKSNSWNEFIFLKGAAEAEKEIADTDGIEEAEIIRLDTPFTNEFFEGKAVVSIRKQRNP